MHCSPSSDAQKSAVSPFFANKITRKRGSSFRLIVVVFCLYEVAVEVAVVAAATVVVAASAAAVVA